MYIDGEVQGVFFRATTTSEAFRRHIAGWVRNLPDGRVEALFEGKKEDVQTMIEFCWKGPRLAKVKNVVVEWEQYEGEQNQFEIR